MIWTCYDCPCRQFGMVIDYGPFDDNDKKFTSFKEDHEIHPGWRVGLPDDLKNLPAFISAYKLLYELEGEEADNNIKLNGLGRYLVDHFHINLFELKKSFHKQG